MKNLQSLFSNPLLMHIGLLIYGSLETVSGGYLYDRKLVQFCRAQGDEVTLISLPWQGYGRHLFHNFSTDLARQLQNSDFDVLLQDELNHPSLFLLNRWLRKRIACPIISIVHHLRCSEQRPVWQNKFYAQVERLYLNSVDGFVFNSRTTQRAVEALAGRRLPDVVAHPAGDRFEVGLSNEQIQARSVGSGPLRILFVGNVISRKGLHTLLDGLAQLPSEMWRLAIVGETAVDPAYTRQIQQQINANNLANNITWHGTLPDADLAREMAQSHVLAVPSSYEGFGIVYLEGMGFGLPAIATTSGAACEIITDGDNGFLLEVGEMARENVAAILAKHFQTLHDNRQRLSDMSLAARRHFLAHPGWEQNMQQIRDFLQRRIGLHG